MKNISQYPDFLTGHSAKVVQRGDSRDLRHLIMFGEQRNLKNIIFSARHIPLKMLILNYNLEDVITVSRHTLVLSQSVEKPNIIIH